MGKTLQMVGISEDVSIFITGFENGIVYFRSTRIPEQIKQGKIERVDENGIAWFDNYHCHVNFINKFISENQEEKIKNEEITDLDR